MIKPCTDLTPEERAAILKAIREGRVHWPYKNATHNATISLADVEAHGLIDRERGVLLLGGHAMTIEVVS